MAVRLFVVVVPIVDVAEKKCSLVKCVLLYKQYIYLWWIFMVRALPENAVFLCLPEKHFYLNFLDSRSNYNKSGAFETFILFRFNYRYLKIYCYRSQKSVAIWITSFGISSFFLRSVKLKKKMKKSCFKINCCSWIIELNKVSR